MIVTVCQRWTDQRASYRPAGEADPHRVIRGDGRGIGKNVSGE